MPLAPHRHTALIGWQPSWHPMLPDVPLGELRKSSQQFDLTQAAVDLYGHLVVGPCSVLSPFKVSHEDLLVLVAQLGTPAP